MMCLTPLAGAWAAAQPPLRVACTDWACAETLLSLGVTPSGVIDRTGYGEVMVEPPLPDSVVDLGAGWAPNVELMQRLAPDLVLVPQWSSRHQQFARIAPIATLPNRIDHLDAIETAAHALPELADRVHAPIPAAQVIQQFEARVSKARDILGARRYKPVLYVTLNADGRHVSIATETSLIHDVLKRIGLVNAWGRQAKVWSFYATGIEQLLRAPDAHILYADQGEKTRIALRLLDENHIWNALPAVRAGHLTPVVPNYPYGGLTTAGRLAEAFAVAIASKGI